MQYKEKNGLFFCSASINEYKDCYSFYKWNNLITAKKVFNSIGLTNNLLSFPQSESVAFQDFSVITLIYEKADLYIGIGVCMREEIKLEYVGYAAMLITYYWHTHQGNYSLNNVPYISAGDFVDFRERVLKYVGVMGSETSWIKRTISDCAHDFFQKELKHNTCQDYEGSYITSYGRKIAWQDAADIMYISCHVLEMQRLGYN